MISSLIRCRVFSTVIERIFSSIRNSIQLRIIGLQYDTLYSYIELRFGQTRCLYECVKITRVSYYPGCFKAIYNYSEKGDGNTAISTTAGNIIIFDDLDYWNGALVSSICRGIYLISSMIRANIFGNLLSTVFNSVRLNFIRYTTPNPENEIIQLSYATTYNRIELLVGDIHFVFTGVILFKGFDQNSVSTWHSTIEVRYLDGYCASGGCGSHQLMLSLEEMCKCVIKAEKL